LLQRSNGYRSWARKSGSGPTRPLRKPDLYEALEERGAKYAIRIPANDCLMRDIAELLTRPVGRPAYKPVVWYKGFLYRASKLDDGTEGVAKVEFHAGELFPRVGFNRDQHAAQKTGRLSISINQRGKAEQWIKARASRR